MGHSIAVSEERGVRYLHFGTEWVQGAMRLSRPHQLVLAYTQEMLSFLLFRPAPLKGSSTIAQCLLPKTCPVVSSSAPSVSFGRPVRAS